MADQVKVLAWLGQGPPPGYRFTVLSPQIVRSEGRFLSAGQYDHGKEILRDIACHADPTHSETQSVFLVELEQYHCVQDKGGILGKINLHIFFYVDKEHGAILILGIHNKNYDGPIRKAVRIRMRRRLRLYKNGGWRMPS
jgi:hypothetical protein